VLLKASAPSGVGPVPVATADDVRVWVTPDEPRRVLHVEVASDRLTAALSVERVPGARYRLEDQPPNQEVLLRRVPVERTPCPPPSVAELRAALRERGVHDGVDTAALGRLAQGRTRETVGHGLAAVPPRTPRSGSSCRRCGTPDPSRSSSPAPRSP
jgi:hypothetical protein